MQGWPLADVRGKLPGYIGFSIQEKELITHVGRRAAQEHLLPIGGITTRIIIAVMAEQLSNVTILNRALIDIKKATITLVTGINDTFTIGRPARGSINDLRLRR